MRSTMVAPHAFASIPSTSIPRSRFNRSSGYKTTFDAGYLIPFFWDEVLPGDVFNCRAELFARLATPIVPFMDNLRLTTFYFSVPIRLIWENWERFNGYQPDPGDTTDFLTPLVEAPAGGWDVGTIPDYLGVPVDKDNADIKAFCTRAYNLIWNEWFRDQNMQDRVVVDVDDGPDAATDYVLLRRGKRHDYFTSCLPWPQKGPAVPLPIGGEAPIRGVRWDGVVDDRVRFESSNNFAGQTRSDGAGVVDIDWTTPPVSQSPITWQQPGDFTGSTMAGYNYADLAQATSSTVNEVRQAVAIQQIYELDARGGTRYIETILAHFGVRSPDARMQRPEFLGGATTPVLTTAIAQTSGTSASGTTTPLGNLAAVGTVSGGNHGFNKSFTEHCIILGLLCVDADLNYQQGLNRFFSQRTRWDYYWPKLSSIGEQAVLAKEIFFQGTADDEIVFGYQERYAEYRYKPSQITGLFRSGVTGDIDQWHLATQFMTRPILDETFIVSDPPVDRVIAVPTQPHFLLDAYINLQCARPMPVNSVPGLTRF